MSSIREIAEAHGKLEELYKAFRTDLKIDDKLELGTPNWTYGVGTEKDDHLEAPKGRPVVFMGFNPGGGNGAKITQVSPSERTWRTRCSRLAGAQPSDIVFTELICVATRKAAELPRGRLEEFMSASVPLNLAIIRFHAPKVVFQTGLDAKILGLVKALYGLQHGSRIVRKTATDQTLGYSYRMDDGTPWIVFRHFASHGFSGDDRRAIQEYANVLGWPGTVDLVT